MPNMLRVLIFSGFLASCLALGSFSFEDCTNSTNRLVRVENIRLDVHPVKFPGNETVGVDVVVLQNVSGLHHQVILHVQKKVFNGFVDVPCISNVGSCKYQVCDLLNGALFQNDPHRCPLEIHNSTPDLHCACPFEPGTYHLNPTTFVLTEPSGVWKFAAQGEYRAKATVIDTANNNEEVGCFIVHVSTESNCKGFQCLIG